MYACCGGRVVSRGVSRGWYAGTGQARTMTPRDGTQTGRDTASHSIISPRKNVCDATVASFVLCKVCNMRLEYVASSNRKLYCYE